MQGFASFRLGTKGTEGSVREAVRLGYAKGAFVAFLRLIGLGVSRPTARVEFIGLSDQQLRF